MNELRIPDLFDVEPMPAAFRSLFRPWRANGDDGAPQIVLDVAETDKAYAVKAEIPGVRKEDIDVRIDGSQVTIAAEVKHDQEEKKDGRVLRSERRYGWASRTFTLGNDVDASAVDARYTNGVLELKLPKKAGSGSRRVTIA